MANAYIEDTKEISNIESNEKEAKNLELNKDKETQTAQVESTKPEQAEQTPVGEPTQHLLLSPLLRQSLMFKLPRKAVKLLHRPSLKLALNLLVSLIPLQRLPV